MCNNFVTDPSLPPGIGQSCRNLIIIKQDVTVAPKATVTCVAFVG